MPEDDGANLGANAAAKAACCASSVFDALPRFFRFLAYAQVRPDSA
jgi:hypothetical protein